ncbi:MAG: hypothetical protein CM1200mP2_31000 [Planctomycetaceae bacterium]|nr:MAG: hypothetical protein CM1200mP2_31000 [Planctomycetaceae bacterium]
MNSPLAWASPNREATRQKMPTGARFISNMTNDINAVFASEISSVMSSTFEPRVVNMPAKMIEKTISGSNCVSAAAAKRLSVKSINSRLEKIVPIDGPSSPSSSFSLAS